MILVNSRNQTNNKVIETKPICRRCLISHRMNVYFCISLMHALDTSNCFSDICTTRALMVGVMVLVSITALCHLYAPRDVISQF